MTSSPLSFNAFNAVRPVGLSAYSKSMKGGGAIEEKATFAVIGATIADNFGVKMPEGTIGHSILEEL